MYFVRSPGWYDSGWQNQAAGMEGNSLHHTNINNEVGLHNDCTDPVRKSGLASGWGMDCAGHGLVDRLKNVIFLQDLRTLTIRLQETRHNQ